MKYVNSLLIPKTLQENTIESKDAEKYNSPAMKFWTITPMLIIIINTTYIYSFTSKWEKKARDWLKEVEEHSAANSYASITLFYSQIPNYPRDPWSSIGMRRGT